MEDTMIFQVPGTITKVSTMSHFLRISVDTQETLSPEAIKRLFELHNKLGWFTMNISPLQIDDIKNLTPIISPNKMSPSKRLRDAIYLLWKKDNQNMTNFEVYYQWYYDFLIASAQSQLG